MDSVIFNIEHFDALMSLLGIIGLWHAYHRLHKIENLNPVERRLKFILLCMLSLLFFRFPDQYIKDSHVIFAILTYVSAIGLSFANFLFFETLMRKHMPLWLKIYMSLSSLYFLIVALMGKLHGNMTQLRPFIAYILISIFFLVLVVGLRKRSEHTPVENQLLNLSLISLVILGPFFLTDIVTLKLDFPNLGALGALIFAYMSMYNQSLFLQNRRILFRFLKSIYLAIFLSFMVWELIPQMPLHIVGRIFAMSLSAILIVRIFYAVKHLQTDSEIFGFVNAVLKSDKSDTKSYLNSMSDFFSKVEKKVLMPGTLHGYDLQLWASVFDSGGGSTLSLFQIREELDEHRLAVSSKSKSPIISSDKKRCFEQVVDVLEKYEMTHILKLNSREQVYIVFQVPMVGYEKLTQLHTDLVRMTSELIVKSEKKS